MWRKAACARDQTRLSGYRLRRNDGGGRQASGVSYIILYVPRYDTTVSRYYRIKILPYQDTNVPDSVGTTEAAPPEAVSRYYRIKASIRGYRIYRIHIPHQPQTHPTLTTYTVNSTILYHILSHTLYKSVHIPLIRPPSEQRRWLRRRRLRRRRYQDTTVSTDSVGNLCITNIPYDMYIISHVYLIDTV